MIFDVPFAVADVQRSERVPLTPALYVKATFTSIQGLIYFVEDLLKPLIRGLLAPTDRDNAIIATYYRIVAYILSIFRLDAPFHFQSVAAASRSILELYLDLALLARDHTADSTERFHSFTRVERLRVAERTVTFFDANPGEAHGDIAAQRALVNDAGERAAVEALLVRFWGRDSRGSLIWPSHWSRYQDARSRARALGVAFEALYVRYSYELSWHIHPGAVGVDGIPREDFDIFVAKAHELVLHAVAEAFTLVGRELHLDAAIEAFDDKVAFLRRIPGLRLIDLRLQELGEPQRFSFVEPERNAPEVM